MKRYTLKSIVIIVVVFFATTTVTSQEIPEQQMPLVTKVTATWCPFCGAWGWDAFEKLYDENQEKAILISNHFSGDLRNPTAETFADNLEAFGQPIFYLNNDNLTFSSSTYSAKAENAKITIAEQYEMSPTANTGVNASLIGNELMVETKTRFFQAASGDYYVGVYIIENGVINFQSSRGNNAFHKNVLRAGMSSNAFGVNLGNGNFSVGTAIDKSFTMTLDQNWNIDNILLATMIWKKEGEKFVYVNGNLIKDWLSTTSTTDLAEALEVNIWPTIANDQVTLTMNTSGTRILAIDVVNQEGKLIHSQLPTSKSYQHHIFDVAQWTSGIYYLRINTVKGVVTKPLVVQHH